MQETMQIEMLSVYFWLHWIGFVVKMKNTCVKHGSIAYLQSFIDFF